MLYKHFEERILTILIRMIDLISAFDLSFRHDPTFDQISKIKCMIYFFSWLFYELWPYAHVCVCFILFEAIFERN